MSSDGATSDRLAGRVAVMSPHLDDGVLSLGAAITQAAGAGADVRVVTVFANDPDDDRPARPWDRACGFTTAAEAARVRREEDAVSCAIMGATPVWLPFADFENVEDGDGQEAAVADAVQRAIQDADVVLVPGFPLVISDHERLTRLVLAGAARPSQLGLYVEQPYASTRLMSRGGRVGSEGGLPQALSNGARMLIGGAAARGLQPPGPARQVAGLISHASRFNALPADRAARRSKRRAIAAHRSQVRGFGPLVLERIALYERGAGGETVAWLPGRRPGP